LVLKTLQAGRGIAALSVAAFHLSITMGNARYGDNPVFQAYTNAGDRGVDFFFVLSGFIILFAHTSDIGHPETWDRYAYRRFVRLFPIYWLYTGVFVLLLFAVGGTDATTPKTLAGWVTSISLIRISTDLPPLSVAWTLCHEVAFYVLFSILIFNLRAGLVAFGLFVLSSLVFYHLPPWEGPTPFSTYTSVYNLYFVFGMGACWLYRHRSSRPLTASGFAELTLGISLVAITFILTIPFVTSRLIAAVGFALILAGLTKLEASSYLRVPLWLAFLGDASYTIYLTHEHAQTSLLKALHRTGLDAAVSPSSVFLIAFLGGTALCCLAYVAVEKPLLALLHSKEQPIIGVRPT
jgi:peptidoglycan/LPS O-acetylase OafA/YrhL